MSVSTMGPDDDDLEIVQVRRCWTCNKVHALDAACPASSTAKTRRNAGPLDDFTADIFDDAPESKPRQKAFGAGYRSVCPGCEDSIATGDMIIGTREGFMHEECALDGN